MDITCGRCGEPWELYYVLHEDPDDFEREGGYIKRCPCCPEREEDVVIEMKERAVIARAISEVLGDDMDGVVSEMESAGL